jgi:group I intron endonuclease
MSQDFSKAKIYKITNDYNNDVYVGSTCDLLTKRFSNHKKSVTNNEKKNRPLYKLMNEIGFERFRIELIDSIIVPADELQEPASGRAGERAGGRASGRAGGYRCRRRHAF